MKMTRRVSSAMRSRRIDVSRRQLAAAVFVVANLGDAHGFGYCGSHCSGGVRDAGRLPAVHRSVWDRQGQSATRIR